MIYRCFPLGVAEKAPPPQIGLSVKMYWVIWQMIYGKFMVSKVELVWKWIIEFESTTSYIINNQYECICKCTCIGCLNLFFTTNLLIHNPTIRYILGCFELPKDYRGVSIDICEKSRKDLRTFLQTLLLCVVTSLGWDKGIFGICTFHIIPFKCLSVMGHIEEKKVNTGKGRVCNLEQKLLKLF